MDADVVISGGGPVGLGLALDLALRGVSTLVLERSTDLHRIPKGQNLTQRTGEHFRTWGISREVRRASPIPREFGNAGMVFWRRILDAPHYDWFARGAVAPYYFAENERLPQYALEAVLRRRAAELDEIRFVEGATVTGVAETAGGVELRYVRDGSEARVRGRWAVGCDGARSRVREAAGIGLTTDHEGPRMALLVFRSRELHELLQRFPGKSIFNVMDPRLDGYWQFLGRVDLDGGWFYHAPVPEGTDGENFDFRAHLHDVVGAPFALEFEHVGFWDLRISRAETYRKGGVFIAGDAAHSHPPYGGYGINTGFEDARNLGWKLAATVGGWAGAALLDSYGAERLPVFASTADDFIHRMIRDDRDFGRRHAGASAESAEFEAAWRRRASAGNIDVTGFLPHYDGSPIVFGRDGARAGAKGRHETTARPGYHLAPQPMADGGDLWDRLGPGFTLIDLEPDDARIEAFRAAARRIGMPLAVATGLAAEARAAWGTSRLLLRPDQFVAWIDDGGDQAPEAVLDRARGALSAGGQSASSSP